MHIDSPAALMAAKLIGAALLVAAGLVVDGRSDARKSQRSKRIEEWRRRRDRK